MKQTAVVRYVLRTFDGKYFKACPGKPALTTNPQNARHFDSEMLAEDFRVFIELTACRSFQISAIAAIASVGTSEANPVVRRSHIPVVMLRGSSLKTERMRPVYGRLA
jgi:hypothetical protein